MFTKKTQLNSENAQVDTKKTKLSAVISIAFIVVIMVGFIYATSCALYSAASSKHKDTSHISLVSFCQTNQCVANITSQGY